MNKCSLSVEYKKTGQSEVREHIFLTLPIECVLLLYNYVPQVVADCKAREEALQVLTIECVLLL
jgi:hypothetical protein